MGVRLEKRRLLGEKREKGEGGCVASLVKKGAAEEY